VLDKAGAKKMTHQEIVRYLNSEHAAGQWWQQMVTVTYEQQRGLRDKHERPSGYQISVSPDYRPDEQQHTRDLTLQPPLNRRTASGSDRVRFAITKVWWACGPGRSVLGVVCLLVD